MGRIEYKNGKYNRAEELLKQAKEKTYDAEKELSTIKTCLAFEFEKFESMIVIINNKFDNIKENFSRFISQLEEKQVDIEKILSSENSNAEYLSVLLENTVGSSETGIDENAQCLGSNEMGDSPVLNADCDITCGISSEEFSAVIIAQNEIIANLEQEIARVEAEISELSRSNIQARRSIYYTEELTEKDLQIQEKEGELATLVEEYNTQVFNLQLLQNIQYEAQLLEFRSSSQYEYLIGDGLTSTEILSRYNTNVEQITRIFSSAEYITGITNSDGQLQWADEAYALDNAGNQVEHAYTSDDLASFTNSGRLLEINSQTGSYIILPENINSEEFSTLVYQTDIYQGLLSGSEVGFGYQNELSLNESTAFIYWKMINAVSPKTSQILCYTNIGIYEIGNTKLNLNYYTQEELDMIIYLMLVKDNRYSNENVRRYIKKIREEENQITGFSSAESDIARWENMNNFELTTDTTIVGLQDGIENFFAGIADIVAADGVISAEQYEQMAKLQYLQARGVFGAQWNYKFSTTIGNMAPALIASAMITILSQGTGAPLAAKLVASTLMGLSSGGSAKEQAMQSGADEGVANLYGTLIGTSEAVLGYFLGKIPGMSETSGLTLSNLFQEGVEEFTQEWISAGLAAVLYGEEVDLSEVSKSSLEAFVMGMMCAGALNGGTAVANFTTTVISFNLNGVKLKTTLQCFFEIYSETESVEETFQLLQLIPIDQLAVINSNAIIDEYTDTGTGNVENSNSVNQVSDIGETDARVRRETVIDEYTDTGTGTGNVENSNNAILSEQIQQFIAQSDYTSARRLIGGTTESVIQYLNSLSTVSAIKSLNLLNSIDFNIENCAATNEFLANLGNSLLEGREGLNGRHYNRARIVAQGVGKNAFLTYCDHRGKHVRLVAMSTLKIASIFRDCSSFQNSVGYASSVDLTTLFVASLYHDVGMAGGIYVKTFENITADISKLTESSLKDTLVSHGINVDGMSLSDMQTKVMDETAAEIINNQTFDYLSDSAIREILLLDGYTESVLDQIGTERARAEAATIVGDRIRSSHTLNSALAILSDGEYLREVYGIDPEAAALIVFAHSKSNSGVTQFAEDNGTIDISKSKWNEAIGKINNAIKTYNKSHPDSPISSFPTLTEYLTDSSGLIDINKLKTLNTSACALKYGDSFAPKKMVGDSYVQNQSGNDMIWDYDSAKATKMDIYFDKNNGTFVKEISDVYDAMLEYEIRLKKLKQDTDLFRAAEKELSISVEALYDYLNSNSMMEMNKEEFFNLFRKEKNGEFNMKLISLASRIPGDAIFEMLVASKIRMEIEGEGIGFKSWFGKSFVTGESNVYYVPSIVDGKLNIDYVISNGYLAPSSTFSKGIVERNGELLGTTGIKQSVRVVLPSDCKGSIIEVYYQKMIAEVQSKVFNKQGITIELVFSD